MAASCVESSSYNLSKLSNTAVETPRWKTMEKAPRKIAEESARPNNAAGAEMYVRRRRHR